MIHPSWYPRPQPQPQRPDPVREGGEVYFLYCCNQVKIGVSRHALNRTLYEIAPYCPAPMFLLGTIPGGFPAERQLHTRFAEDRRDGEWFSLSQELREFLCQDDDRSRKLAASEDHYFEWLLREIETQKENPMNEFAETRSMLKKMAIKEGPDTPSGHGAFNILELTETLAKGAEGEQRRQVLANLDRQQNRLAEIHRTVTLSRGDRQSG